MYLRRKLELSHMLQFYPISVHLYAQEMQGGHFGPRAHPPATAWGCQSLSKTILLFALTLRGPSGGHCVELEGDGGVVGVVAARMGKARHTLGSLRAPSVCRAFANLEAPRSGPRRVITEGNWVKERRN